MTYHVPEILDLIDKAEQAGRPITWPYLVVAVPDSWDMLRLNQMVDVLVRSGFVRVVPGAVHDHYEIGDWGHRFLNKDVRSLDRLFGSGRPGQAKPMVPSA